MYNDNHDDPFNDQDGRRPQQKAGKTGLFLALGGVATVLVLLLVTAFIWPGFARFVGGGGENELLSLAPKDSDFAAGISLTSVRKEAGFNKVVEQLREMARTEGIPADFIDLIADIDRVVVAGTIQEEKESGKKPFIVLALSTLKPYDQEKLKKLPFLGAAETDKGMTFHRVTLPGPADPDAMEMFLAMPDAKLLVLGVMPKKEFVKSLQNRTGKPVISPKLLAVCRRNENTYLWAGVANQGPLKMQLAAALAGDVPWLPPASLGQLQSAGFGLDVISKDGMKLEVKVHCAEAADAESLKKSSEEGWTQLTKNGDITMAIGGKQTEPFKRMYDDAKKSFKLTQSGALLIASLRVSEAAVKELEKQGDNNVGVPTLLVPAVKKVRDAVNRTRGTNKLKQIALAMYSHHDHNGRFPSAAVCDKSGKPLLSWRVTMLPYFNEVILYEEFHLNEPWDSKHNIKFLSRMPKVYLNAKSGDPRPDHTNYRVLVGGGAGFEWKKGLSIREITDSTAETLMVVEAAESVPWTKPDELVYDAKKPLPRFDNVQGRGFSAAMFNLDVKSFPHGISEATMRAIISRAAGDRPGKDFPR